MRTIVCFTRDLRLDDQSVVALAARAGEIVPVVVIDPATSANFASLAAARRILLQRSGGAGVGDCTAWRPADRAARTHRHDAAGARASGRRRSGRMERLVRRARSEIRPRLAGDARGLGDPGDAGPRCTRGRPGRDRRRTLPAIAPSFRTSSAGRRPTSCPSTRLEARFERLEVGSEALPVPAEFGSRLEFDAAVEPDAVRRRFERFLESEVLHYGITRNVPADDGTSRLGAELSFGLVAARTIVSAVRARRNDPLLLTEERMSLGIYLRALAQRDFFLQLAYSYETLDEAPLQEKMRAFTFAKTHPALDAWRSGRTGYPLVDAGMRELRATGWMHPRVRSIAASFLCFDLGVDWRVGRDEWDRWLIEDEPALAAGNWQWVAGIGADLAAYPRIYNPRRGARRFDPAGRYIRRWIPELASRGDAALFEPESEGRRSQLSLALYGEHSYPDAVVDHVREARAVLARYAREVAVDVTLDG